MLLGIYPLTIYVLNYIPTHF